MHTRVYIFLLPVIAYTLLKKGKGKRPKSHQTQGPNQGCLFFFL